jgi:hypothetical protein
MTFASVMEKVHLTFSGRETAGELTGAHIESLQEPDSFMSVARGVLGLDEQDDEHKYIEQFGAATLEGARAAVVKALGTNMRVQFQFTSAYDFGVSLSTYDDALVVHFSGPTREDAAARRGETSS